MNNIKTKLLFFALMGIVFLSNAFVWWVSALELGEWIQLNYAITEDKKAVLVSYVNESSWLKVRLLYSVLSLFVLHCGWFYPGLIKDVICSFLSVIQLIKKEVLSLTRQEVLFMGSAGVVFFGLLIWYSNQVYIQLDELNSWLYFVDRGPLVTMAYYPSSNNHIGYNVVSIFWNYFFQPVIAIRLTSMLSALGFVWLLYIMLVKNFQPFLARLGVLMVMGLAPFVWYAIQGRGYVLELFILLLLAFLVFQKSDRKFDWSFVFLSVFALYIIPIALIPVGLLMLFYLYAMRHDLCFVRRIILVSLSIVCLSLLIYAPVWIFSNAQLVFCNPHVKEVAWSEAPLMLITNYYPSLWMFITGTAGMTSISIAVAMLLLSLWMLIKGKKSVLIAVGIVVFFPSLLFLIYPVLLYERTWIWLLFPFVWWILEIFLFLKASYRFTFYLIVPLFIGILFYSNAYKLYAVQQGAREMEMLLNELRAPVCKSEGIVRIEDDVLFTYFRFYEKTCQFSLAHGVSASQEGDWLVLPVGQCMDGHGIVVCKNSMGVLYKSK